MANLTYFKKFDTKSDYDTYIGGTPVLPNVSIVADEDVYFKDGEDPEPTPSHDYVEIGGIKWATMNLGATAITDYGKYYAWGETQGYTASQVGTNKNFSEQDYVYGPINWASEPDYGITKYNSQDGLTALQSSDDAVSVEWGGSWRMPTATEWQALGAAVNISWTSDYQGSGIAGLICTDKADSAKVLFFPAANYYEDGATGASNDTGHYWSSSLYGEVDISNAYRMNFGRLNGEGRVTWACNELRYPGASIRGILDE